jgi:hypothetical protein
VSGKQKPFVDDNGDQTIIEKTGNGWETVHERTEPEHPNDSDDDGTQIRQEAMGKKHKIILWLGIAVLWILLYEISDTIHIALLTLLQRTRQCHSVQLPVLRHLDLQPYISPWCSLYRRHHHSCHAQATRSQDLRYLRSRSDILPRGVAIILSYILCATARGYDQYAGSYIVYCIGQTSMQILNQLIVADITTSK